jgi:hypothetical protein
MIRRGRYRSCSDDTVPDPGTAHHIKIFTNNYDLSLCMKKQDDPDRLFKTTEKMMKHFYKYVEKNDISEDEFITTIIIMLSDLVSLADDPIKAMKEITDVMTLNIDELMRSEEFLKQREEFLKD